MMFQSLYVFAKCMKHNKCYLSSFFLSGSFLGFHVRARKTFVVWEKFEKIRKNNARARCEKARHLLLPRRRSPPTSSSSGVERKITAAATIIHHHLPFFSREKKQPRASTNRSSLAGPRGKSRSTSSSPLSGACRRTRGCSSRRTCTCTGHRRAGRRCW